MKRIGRDRIFISASVKDAEWRDQLKAHLAPHLKADGISIWDATQIAPGARWRDEIEEALKSARAALLLVSSDYLAEAFEPGGQLPALLDAAAGSGLSILWIPVRASSYESTPLADYQPLHDPQQPLGSLSASERDQALVAICEKIAAHVKGAPASIAPSPPVVSGLPGERRGPDRARSSPGAATASATSWRDPASMLKAAVTAVPVMRYALGVAGLGAVVAIVTRGFGLDPGTATVGSLVVVVLMTVLLVLAVAARQSQHLQRQAMLLTWAFVLLTAGASTLLLASLFFQWPRPLRCLVQDDLCRSPAPVPDPGPSTPALIDLPVQSTPSGAKVWSRVDALLCERTPCTLKKVPAHAPLELRFTAPGREGTFQTPDPSAELERGGVQMRIPLSKVP